MAATGAQYDEEWEDDSTADLLHGLTATSKDAFYSSSTRVEDEDGNQDEELVMSSRVDGPRDMWGQEVIMLIRNTVETTRRALQNSLASSGLTEDAASQTKLTIQLKSQGLREFPAEAVELLKADVERLVISHNSIQHLPYAFSDLQSLTFLNVRANRLREFPKAFLKLSKLQMLDICQNHLARIPDEIDQMKSLKVLSASGNSLTTIPNSLGHLEALRVLKIENNPLNESLQRIIAECGGYPAGNIQLSQQVQHELDLTARLKEQLRFEASSQESGGDSSEGPLETPRPLRRNNSLRFPVAIPGLSSSESTPDLTSPSTMRAFSASRSHQRVISGTGGPHAASRRPGISPLLIASDRNRSNSEGLLQASQNSRPKRLGLSSKKAQELGVLDERGANRNSLHLRGVSYGSAIKDRSGTGRPVGRSNLSNGSSVSDMDFVHHEGHQFRRLSSLPEADLPDIPGYPASGVQACRGLLYALHQIHTYIDDQPAIIKLGTPKRSSLERVYYNATTHLDNLDSSLFNMYAAAEDEDHARDDAARQTREAGRNCCVAYKQVIDHIAHSAQQYVLHTDARFIRSFLFTLYACVVEATNAAIHLRKMIDEHTQPVLNKARRDTARDRLPKLTVRQTTPIKEKPRGLSSRLRSNTLNRPSSRMKGSSNPYSAVPLYLNRSRSNSRTTAGVSPSANSSATGTPRSGDSFHIPQSPGLPTPGQDYSPAATADFNNQDLFFEKVHYAFNSAVDPGMASLPIVLRSFKRSLQLAIDSRGGVPKRSVDAWSRLVSRSRNCHEACEALRARLAAVKLKDLEVRRSQEFWGYCTRYVNQFVRLADEVKAARTVVQIDAELVRMLKPIHVSVKAAVNALKSSPWAYVLESSSSSASASAAPSRSGSHAGSPAHSRAQSKDTPPPMPIPILNQTYMNGGGGGNGAIVVDRLQTTGLVPNVRSGSSASGSLSARARGDSETSLSPYMPQTPLSAALGPAAQATMPATLPVAQTLTALPGGGGGGSMGSGFGPRPGTPPAKSSFDTSFRGDVFERADTLLRSQSVIGHRR